MKYVLLIYDDEQLWAGMSEEERNGIMGEYVAYSEEIFGAGVATAGDALQATSSATTVRIRDGHAVTTDGPYAETKEQLGGYYVIEAADLDEAIRWAAKIPSARIGSIEVRPILEFLEAGGEQGGGDEG